MRQKNILIMLTLTLLTAVFVLTGVLVHLYRNVYYIPERAVTDLCAALEADGLKDTLSQEAREGLTSPAQRYQQLKDAVENR